MRRMAEGTPLFLDREMHHRGVLYCGGKIRMAFKAEVARGFFEKGLFVGFVRVVALRTGTDCGRAMAVLMGEAIFVVASETELSLVSVIGQEHSAIGAMGIMTNVAVALLDRRVDIFLLPEPIMAGGAELLLLPAHGEGFYPGKWMFLSRLLMAHAAANVAGRVYIANLQERLMTGGVGAAIIRKGWKHDDGDYERNSRYEERSPHELAPARPGKRMIVIKI